MIYITGDKHGDFSFLEWFCEDDETTKQFEKKQILLSSFQKGKKIWKDNQYEIGR